MSYNRTFWVDHVVDQNGNVIQQGTLVDQDHLNNQEVGIFNGEQFHDELLRILLMNDNRTDALEGETVDVVLKNTQTYPFNNSKASVQLTKDRNKKDYTVDVEVTAVTGGAVGDIYITDKLVNGFKIEYTGSATSVAATLHIRGGV